MVNSKVCIPLPTERCVTERELYQSADQCTCYFAEGKAKAESSQNIDIEWCVCFERKRTQEASRTILITAMLIVLYKWSRCNTVKFRK